MYFTEWGFLAKINKISIFMKGPCKQKPLVVSASTDWGLVMSIPKAKVGRVAHRERIAVMGKSRNEKKDDGGLPWYVGDPDPTAEVVETIVNRFHTYAMLGQGKLHSGNEEEKRIARTFLECEGFVREYFKDKARQIDTPEARNKAHDVLQLVVKFYDWFHPGGQVTEQEMESYMKLLRRWERVVQRFNMCMPSGNQAKKPGETWQKDERSKIMITAGTSKENWEAIRSEYDISKKDFGKKINFVSDPFKRNVIFRDVEHAFVLASHGFSKPALILAGGVIEELLRQYLEHKDIKPKNKRFVDYIKACENNDLLKRGASRLSDSIRDFRNLVHLENEKTKRHTVSKATAKGAVSSIFTIANDFQ